MKKRSRAGYQENKKRKKSRVGYQENKKRKKEAALATGFTYSSLFHYSSIKDIHSFLKTVMHSGIVLVALPFALFTIRLTLYFPGSVNV